MRKATLFVILVGLVTLCNGQSMKIGVFADPMISWLTPESRSIQGDGSRMGIDVGLMLDRYFQKNYALQTGVSLGTQGGKLHFDEEAVFLSYGERDTLDPGARVNYQLNFVTVPLGLKLKTNQIGYFSYFARLGFTNQFNLKAKVTSSDGILENSTIEDAIFFYNLSYFIGVGFQYNLSEDTALNFGLNYNHGFIDLSKGSDFKLFSRAVSLRVAVIF